MEIFLKQGYNASVAYVKSQLQNNTNYDVYEQFFTVSQMVYSQVSFTQVKELLFIGRNKKFK